MAESNADQSSAAPCAYCGHRADLHYTGRRWLCRHCYEEALGESPAALDEEQARG
jgi:hypothetical protein